MRARLQAIRRAGKAIVEKQQRIGRARAQMRAEHRIEGNDAFQSLVRQFIIEHIGDIDQHEAQEFAHVVAAKAFDLEAKAPKRQKIAVADARQGAAASCP